MDKGVFFFGGTQHPLSGPTAPEDNAGGTTHEPRAQIHNKKFRFSLGYSEFSKQTSFITQADAWWPNLVRETQNNRKSERVVVYTEKLYDAPKSNIHQLKLQLLLFLSQSSAWNPGRVDIHVLSGQNYKHMSAWLGCRFVAEDCMVSSSSPSNRVLVLHLKWAQHPSNCFITSFLRKENIPK